MSTLRNLYKKDSEAEEKNNRDLKRFRSLVFLPFLSLLGLFIFGQSTFYIYVLNSKGMDVKGRVVLSQKSDGSTFGMQPYTYWVDIGTETVKINTDDRLNDSDYIVFRYVLESGNIYELEGQLLAGNPKRKAVFGIFMGLAFGWLSWLQVKKLNKRL